MQRPSRLCGERTPPGRGGRLKPRQHDARSVPSSSAQCFLHLVFVRNSFPPLTDSDVTMRVEASGILSVVVPAGRFCGYTIRHCSVVAVGGASAINMTPRP